MALKKTDPTPSSPKPLENYELRILRSLRRIIRAVDIHSRRLFSSTTLTGPQLLSLITIEKEGPMTSAEIGAQIFLSPSTLVGILDRLEEKEFIRRKRDSKDRRKVFVSVTGKGRRAISKSPSPIQDRLGAALSGLSDLEKSTIALSLDRIVDFLEAKDIDAAPILETGPLGSENRDGESGEPFAP